MADKSGRGPNVGDGKSFSVTIPAGLYEFLTRHARRAIIGKNEGEVAVFLMQQQAVTYDREDFLAIKLPTQDFPAPDPKPPPSANTPSIDG